MRAAGKWSFVVKGPRRWQSNTKKQVGISWKTKNIVWTEKKWRTMKHRIAQLLPVLESNTCEKTQGGSTRTKARQKP